MYEMRRTVRTRGARTSYCGQPSTSYGGIPLAEKTISLQQMENILAQNAGSFGQDHLEGLFTKIDGVDEQSRSTPPPTEEEITLCGAKVDEVNFERLHYTYPYIEQEKLKQIYELCEKNIVRTIDNINFYCHINRALQNAFKKIRCCALYNNWKSSAPTLESFEAFADAFVKGSQQEPENVPTPEDLDQPVAGPSHFEC